MEPMHLSPLVRQGWKQLFAHYGRVLFLTLLICFAANVVASGTSSVVGLILTLVSTYFAFALQNVCLSIAKNQEPTFDLLAIDLKRYLYYLLSFLILTFGIGLFALAIVFILQLFISILPAWERFFGLIAAVGGVLVVMVLFARLGLILPYFILEKSSGPIEAIKQSWQVTSGHSIMMLGLLVICFVLNFVGLLLLGVGLFVSIPWTYTITALVYKKLSLGE